MVNNTSNHKMRGREFEPKYEPKRLLHRLNLSTTVIKEESFLPNLIVLFFRRWDFFSWSRPKYSNYFFYTTSSQVQVDESEVILNAMTEKERPLQAPNSGLFLCFSLKEGHEIEMRDLHTDKKISNHH